MLKQTKPNLICKIHFISRHTVSSYHVIEVQDFINPFIGPIILYHIFVYKNFDKTQSKSNIRLKIVVIVIIIGFSYHMKLETKFFYTTVPSSSTSVASVIALA